MMLRINELVGESAGARLAVEGRLVAQTLPALQQACDEALAKDRGLELDVSQVQFVDTVGLDFLRRLEGSRVRLVGCTGFLHELLKTAPVESLDRSTR